MQQAWVDEDRSDDRFLFIRNHSSKNPLVDMTMWFWSSWCCFLIQIRRTFPTDLLTSWVPWLHVSPPDCHKWRPLDSHLLYSHTYTLDLWVTCCWPTCGHLQPVTLLDFLHSLIYICGEGTTSPKGTCWKPCQYKDTHTHRYVKRNTTITHGGGFGAKRTHTRTRAHTMLVEIQQ